METLTKENFWNNMEKQYPKAMARFKLWIDRYKAENGWDILLFPAKNNLGEFDLEHSTKFHQLPLAMQGGIWIEFMATSGNYDDDKVDFKTFFVQTQTMIEEDLATIDNHG